MPINFILNRKEVDCSFSSRIKLTPGLKYIVNVGSVGQPRDGKPQAAYALYDSSPRKIEIRRVAYDIKSAQKKIINAGLPRVLAERLSVGR